MQTTEGTLLDGRLRYAQPAEGFRSGIEPVLLAATIPARPGDRVLEAGSGAGAGLLCLAARVPGIIGVGVEIDPALVALANDNAHANGLGNLEFVASDITSETNFGQFDHACANPPYHPPSGTPSPLPTRAFAKIAQPGLLPAWIAGLARALRLRGTLSLILPVSMVPACCEALARAKCGSISLLPLWPREGRPAKLSLLQAVRGGRRPFQLLPGLVLHDQAGFTTAANGVLRHALPLDWHSPAERQRQD